MTIRAYSTGVIGQLGLAAFVLPVSALQESCDPVLIPSLVQTQRPQRHVVRCRIWRAVHKYGQISSGLSARAIRV
jgi:hypothetical protein